VSEALLVSQVVLWTVVVVLACVVFALARQIGILYERVAPAGALMMQRGPSVGDVGPTISAEDLAGRPLTVGGPRSDRRRTLVLFVSPTCPVCSTLLPVLRSVARREGGVHVVLVSDGPGEHDRFVREHRVEHVPYVLSATLGLTYQVGRLPYAVLLDGDGVIRSKGLVNSREHLESLFEAHERGVTSLQDFLGRTGAASQ